MRLPVALLALPMMQLNFATPVSAAPQPYDLVIYGGTSAGVAAAFYATLLHNARKLGYSGCEMSWILEDNILMNRSLEAMGAKRYKTYRIYEWN